MSGEGYVKLTDAAGVEFPKAREIYKIDTAASYETVRLFRLVMVSVLCSEKQTIRAAQKCVYHRTGRTC